MLAKDVCIGETYVVRVSGLLAPVKIVEKHHVKGWWGENIRTGRRVRIPTAGKLRGVLAQKQADMFKVETEPKDLVKETMHLGTIAGVEMSTSYTYPKEGRDEEKQG